VPVVFGFPGRSTSAEAVAFYTTGTRFESLADRDGFIVVYGNGLPNTPDSANDDAGLAAMTKLIPSTASPVHFLVPLPGAISPSALDLFGFWTYELRCGHLQWSTAQGRFGRPLRVAGVQHPCPPLTVNVERIITVPTTGGPVQPCISATADLAQTVLSGVSLTSPAAPQTQIWFLLYAQLRRADGDAWRNLLLAKLPGTLQGDPLGGAAPTQQISAMFDLHERWHYNLFGLSVLTMLILLGLLITSYLRLNVGTERSDSTWKWCVDIPFSIYLGWITVATVVNISDWLYSVHWNGFGIDPTFFHEVQFNTLL